jgi:hypothetical protein
MAGITDSGYKEGVEYLPTTPSVNSETDRSWENKNGGPFA